MARGRPFGVWAYSFGPYSRWHQVVMDPLSLHGRGGLSRSELMLPILHLVSAKLSGRSHLSPLLTINAVINLEAPLAAQSGMQAPLRYFWEHEPPSECGDDWSPGMPCVVAWTPAAGCDVAWVVQPKPPFACPEVIHG